MHHISKPALVFYNNFVPKTHRNWDIDFEKCRDLQMRVKGHSRSSKPTRIHLPPMTSY